MDRGVFLNLFEIVLPSSPFSLLTKEWDQALSSLSTLRQELLPARLYASEETKKLYVYGSGSEHATSYGFASDEFTPNDDPRLMGRLIIEAIVHYLTGKHGFEPQQRPYVAKVHEVTDITNQLGCVEKRLDVYPSYRVQSLFLKILGDLKFFLLIRPKVRYRFRHSLGQVHASVDCTGRFIRIACPVACDVYDCELYEYRGKLAGKFAELTGSNQFRCRFLETASEGMQFVLHDDARFAFALPIEVCELEASIPNISAIFSQRFSPSKASNIISELRVIAGDLLPGTPKSFINTEVGQKRWANTNEFIQLLKGDIPLFDSSTITIVQEPVRAIEGGFMPGELLLEEEAYAEDEADEFDDDVF